MPLVTAAVLCLAVLGTGISDEPTVAAPPPELAARPVAPPSPAQSPSPSPAAIPTRAPSPSPSPRPDVPVVAAGDGTFTTAGGSHLSGTGGRLVRYLVEVEDGLGIAADDVAEAVDAILDDPRSWTGEGDLRLERVAGGSVQFRVTLASPATVDRLCRPLDTGGWLSCWNGGRALLNVDRWLHGAPTYGDDVAGYRRYLVNHEVGHALGHDHVGCPGRGQLAPVMVQQTKSLSGCLPNPWPHPDNDPTAGPSPTAKPDPSPSPAPSEPAAASEPPPGPASESVPSAGQ